MKNTRTHEELQAELVDRAVEDEAFRRRLFDDPKAAIKDALGVTVPKSMSIAVHEDTATTVHLVLPPSAKLSSADLEGVAGGHVAREGFYQDGDLIDHSHG